MHSIDITEDSSHAMKGCAINSRVMSALMLRAENMPSIGQVDEAYKLLRGAVAACQCRGCSLGVP